jgi:ParB-like nuclease domain
MDNIELNTKIELIDVDKLHEYKKNPRKITKIGFDELCASIREDHSFLYSNPIKCFINDDQITVYGGHQRLKACKKLGIVSVPCIIDYNVNEKVIKDRVIKDNTSYGKYDTNKLALHYSAQELKKFEVLKPKIPFNKINGIEVKKKRMPVTMIFNFDNESYGYARDLVHRGLIKSKAENAEALLIKLLNDYICQES